MNKKTIIIIISIFILIIVGILLMQKKKKGKPSPELETPKRATVLDDEEVDSDGFYVIVDENGEEITRVQDKYEVQKYLDNPDYHPGPMYGEYETETILIED